MLFDAPVLLYGAGREARSTLQFLQEVAPDTPVYVTSDDGRADLAGAIAIATDELPDAFAAKKFGLIVKSPGVSLYKPIFKTARKAGIPITSNLNLWGDHFREGCKVVAVTGTKGKSTTAVLTHLMLEHSGIDAGLAGNVGIAPLDARDTHDVVVLELSSYQTADMDFTPDIVGITSLYPEHVDWHGSVEQYYADKLRLIDRKGKFQVALSQQAHAAKQVRKALHHSTRRIMVLEPLIADAVEDAVSKSRLRGEHNLENARLATRLAMAAGATLDGVLAGIAAFTPLPHRLEEHTIGAKTIVNDSISTTPEATRAALVAYAEGRIALIAGGHEREQDYADLVGTLAQSNVTVLATLPVTGTRLAAATRKAAPGISVIEAETLAEAMKALSGHPDAFDTLILSPGAPSYNQFRNFEERGSAFVELAQQHFGASP